VVAISNKREHGTFMLGVYMDDDDDASLWTIAAYESEEYLAKVHAMSAPAQPLSDRVKHARATMTTIVMKKQGGFLYKPESVRIGG
jgi:hypothetical protein